MKASWHNLTLGLLVGVAYVAGCSTAPKGTAFIGPVYESRLIAVAPAMNLSGSKDFDPIRLGDLMASELEQMPGIKVIGVNRVLAVLNAINQERTPAPVSVRDPAQALQVVKALGADEILVFAVTEYDPYDPPTVGISAQVYGFSAISPHPDAETADRESNPALVGMGAEDAMVPRAQVQRVFRASHKEVLHDVEEFGKERDARKSAYGWRRYVVSQEDYFRYCCHAVLKELLGRNVPRVVANAESPKDEEGMP
jgi:hypothetical protein